MPGWLYQATGGAPNPRNPWWSLAIIVVSGLAYAGVIASTRRQLYAMVLWLFTYVFMGLAPYVQYRLDVSLSTTPYLDASLYPLAGVVMVVCSLAALAGSLLAGQSRRPARTLRPTLVDRRNANLLTLVAVALFLYYGNAIGFGSFLLSRGELSSLRAATWGNPATMNLLTGGLNMTLLVAFLAQMAVRRQRLTAGLRASMLPALMMGVLLLYVVNPVNTARYVAGTVILAILAALGAYATVNRARIVAVAALAGLLFLFPIADTFRHSTSESIQVENPVTALTSGDFDAFAQFVNTLDYLDASGPTYGWQLVGVLLFWVPRSLWPGKPEDTGIVLADYMGYKFANISSPMWTELAINFGVVGAVLGMGLLGYWFRSMDRATDAHLRVFPVPPLLAGVTTFYLLIVLRGSLLNAMSSLAVVLLASWFVTRKSRRAVAGSQHPAPRHVAATKVVTART